jgi:hypothetical protein
VGLLTTITLEVVPFHAIAPFSAILALFKCILGVLFCEGVQHRLRFYSITSPLPKWRPFSSIFNRGNRKLGWVEDNSRLISGQKFPGKKGSVRRCVVVMQQPVILSPKFEAKFSHICIQSP